MIYIWLDESDKKGQYYSNFYGGILIKSDDLDDVLSQARDLFQEKGIWEEIKWQKVNKHTYEAYLSVVDFIFRILAENKAKIRIFFRNNQNKPINLTEEQRRNEFTILYYEFIKNAFGLQYCDMPDGLKDVSLYLDEIPASGSQIAEFRHFLVNLNDDSGFKRNGIKFHESRIVEVKSDEEIPLQLLDLILGAMCFRLNNKHLIKDPITGKRGIRTKLKERLYKYINKKIRELRPNFNIGISTGINSYSDKWTHPYRHWSFVPKAHTVDSSMSKP